MRFSVLWQRSLLATVVLAAGCGAPALQPLGYAPLGTPAVRVLDSRSAPAIENFRKINDGLYRSGLPDDAQMAAIKALGVRTVVNLMNPTLKHEAPLVAHEKETAAKLGLKWVNIPLPFGVEPPKAMVSQYFSILEDKASQPVLVHCKKGRDRTGTMIAAYRIRRDGFTGKQALEEMQTFGFKTKDYPFFTSFVLKYDGAADQLLAGRR